LCRYFAPKQDYTDVWITNKTSSLEKQFHPTQKPIAIIQRMVEASTREGDKILDPFMGSGTTGVAALRLNRKFIGIEKDENYFKLAEKRISEELKQNKLMLQGV